MIFGIAYALFALVVTIAEVNRRKRSLYDQLSLLKVFYLINIIVPAAAFHILLDTGLLDADAVNFPILNHFYRSVTVGHKLLLFLGSVCAYFGLVAGYRLGIGNLRVHSAEIVVHRVKPKVLTLWIAICCAFVVLMFVFGSTLSPGDPIGGLMLATYFRADDPYYAFQRTALNANIYSSTTTFLLLSLFGIPLIDERRRRAPLLFVFTVFCIFLDALASGARRNLLIASTLAYFYIASRQGKYKPQIVIFIVAMSVPTLYFGKAILRNLTHFDVVAEIVQKDAPIDEQVFVAACETGISYVESLGTIALYDQGPRLGMDHVLSFLRMIPFGTFGYEKPFPERIVRLSTTLLSGDHDAQDIPPGYLGQCWIDLPVLGFFLMPFFHGIAFALIERIFARVVLAASPFYLMAYIIAGYIAALPFNSGTLDFICSPEIVFSICLILGLHVLDGRLPLLRQAANPRGSGVFAARTDRISQAGSEIQECLPFRARGASH